MGKRVKRAAHRVRRGARRVGAAMETKPGKVLVMALEATAGGVGTSMIINKFAPASLSPLAKSGIQAALGLGMVMFVRNRHVKSAGAGAVIAAMMSVAQNTLKVSALSGPSYSRTLTGSEFDRLVNGMNLPLSSGHGRGGMNLPLAGSVPSGAGFQGGFGNKR